MASDYDSDTSVVPWYTERSGVLVLVFYAVFAIAAGFVAMGRFLPNIVNSASVQQTNPVIIPPYIYLFAFIGAMAYVFVTLVANVDTDTETLVRVGLRVPAALLLVTGAYLLGTMLEVAPATAAERAGIAFLVGLFIKHAIDGFSAISARLYPGNPSELFDESRRKRGS